MRKIKTVLQINHGYNPPFGALANNYARVFNSTDYRFVQVFLTGVPDLSFASSLSTDDVIFLDLPKRQLSGIKFTALLKVFKIIRSVKPDLIIAQRYKSIYLSIIASMFCNPVTVIGVAHAFGVMHSKGRRLIMRMFINRLHMLGVSNAVAEDLLNDMGPSWQGRIHPLLNCVDVDLLKDKQMDRQSARKRLNLSNESYVFGNVGRLHSEKDPLTLIGAFARVVEQMPKAKLVFIGTGRLQAEMLQTIEQLGLQEHILLLGNVDNAAQFFRAFDVYVSTSPLEPFGIVLTEAMAAKLQILAAEGAGASEVVTSVSQLFPAHDQQKLSALMLRVYQKTSGDQAAENPEAYQRLCKEFSQEAFNKRFKQLPIEW